MKTIRALLAAAPLCAAAVQVSASGLSGPGVGTTVGTVAAGNDARIVGAVQASGGKAGETVATPSGGSIASTIAALFGLNPSIISYGADPTGVADSAPAFLAACAAHPGDVIDVPAGTYLWNTAESFTTPCLFQGHGFNERQNLGFGTPSRTGSWILISNTAISPVTLNFQGRGGFQRIGIEQVHAAPTSTSFTGTTTSGSAQITAATVAPAVGDVVSGTNIPTAAAVTAVSGSSGNYTVTLDHAATASESAQSLSFRHWAPTVYPAVFTFGPNAGGEFDLNDLYAYGVYDLTAQASGSGTIGHLFLNGLRGQIFHTAFAPAVSLDIVHADDWHLWPYYSQDAAVLTWTQINGNPIILARSDGFQSDHLFMLGYNTCVTLGNQTTGSTTGPTTNFDVGDLYCDDSKNAVHVVGNNVTAHFGKVTHQGSYASGAAGYIAGSQAYLDDAAGTDVAIDRLVAQGNGGSAAALTNAAGTANLSIASAFVASSNQDNKGAAVFSIKASTGLSTIKLGTAPNLTGSFNGAATAAANGNIITNVWQAWTPTLYGDSAAGTPTYGNQVGRFVVIGNTVTVQGLVGASLSGATGNLRIGGLPFPNKTGVQAWGSVGYASGLTLDTGYTQPSFAMSAGEQTLLMLEQASGKGEGIIPAANGSGANIGFSLTYQAF